MFTNKWLDKEAEPNGSAGTPPASSPATVDAAELEKKLEAAQKDASHWQEAYKGLQKVVEVKSGELISLKTQADAAISQAKTLGEQLAALTGEKTTLRTQLTEREAAHAVDKANLARLRLVAEQFPQILPMELQGFTPQTDVTATPETLGEIFTKYVTTLNSITGLKKEEWKAGGQPPPPTGERKDASSAAAEMKLANECAGKGDVKGYNQHYQRYLELSQTS
jgi:hypothetical protein